MATRNQIKERSIEKVRRERAPVPWQYCLIGLLCAVILAIGFFFAAKQHFSSIDLSMKNSKMREAKEKLEADQRKLKAEREGVASEAAIEKAGLKMGLRKLASEDYQFIDAARNTAPADNSKTVADNKSNPPAGTDKTGSAKVTKTVSVRSVDADRKDPVSRSGKTDIAKAAIKDTGRMLIAKK